MYTVTAHGFNALIQYSVDNQTKKTNNFNDNTKKYGVSDLKCVNLCDISNLTLVVL